MKNDENRFKSKKEMKSFVMDDPKAEIEERGSSIEILPRSKFEDGEKLYFGTDEDFSLYFEGSSLKIATDTTEIFKFSYSSNVSYLRGAGVAGDDLYFYANSGEDRPGMFFYGGAQVELACASGSSIILKDNTTQIIKFTLDTDGIIETEANRNIYLKPGGTGSVKFGTEITNAGNARGKLIKIITGAGDTIYLKTFDTV